MDCPFCSESILKAQFAESKHCRAVYNISPILPGHSMVIPKRHFRSLADLPDEVYQDLMLFMRQVSEILQKAFQAAGINWTLQEGEEAGQTVPHLHFHLIPRQPADLPEPGDWYPKLREQQVIDSAKRPRLSEKEMEEVVLWLRTYFEKHE
ncbi:MAG TPA: HIT family protein [Bacteroidales bacterium]|nr:HIT family protein [Bacteroidales bacterium]